MAKPSPSQRAVDYLTAENALTKATVKRNELETRSEQFRIIRANQRNAQDAEGHLTPRGEANVEKSHAFLWMAGAAVIAVFGAAYAKAAADVGIVADLTTISVTGGATGALGWSAVQKWKASNEVLKRIDAESVNPREVDSKKLNAADNEVKERTEELKRAGQYLRATVAMPDCADLHDEAAKIIANDSAAQRALRATEQQQVEERDFAPPMY